MMIPVIPLCTTRCHPDEGRILTQNTPKFLCLRQQASSKALLSPRLSQDDKTQELRYKHYDRETKKANQPADQLTFFIAFTRSFQNDDYCYPELDEGNGKDRNHHLEQR